MSRTVISRRQGAGRVGAFSVAVWGIAAICASQEASAQDGANEVEEIVVTARGRQESLQEIPLSVTSFSEAEIENAAITNLEDIALRTPGLHFNTQLSGIRTGRLLSNMRFRGVEGSEFSSLQTASLFVDGVFVLQGAQSLSLSDVERVEVIRGPQSARFGRNSFAGAVNYITKTPNLEEVSGRFTADAGQYGQFEVAASIEGPLVDNRLSARLNVRSYNKGDMYTATDGGALGAESSESVSATLYSELSDSTSLKLHAFFQVDDDGPAANAFLKFTGDDQGNDTCSGTTRAGYDADGNPTTLHPRNFWCGKLPNPGDPRAPIVDSNTSLRPQHSAFTGLEDFLITNLLNAPQIEGLPRMDSLGIKREMLRLSLTGTHILANDISIEGTIAYNENKAAHVRDHDLHPIESWWINNPQSGEDKSIDLRVTSPEDQRIRWLGGINYYEQEFLTNATGGVHIHVCGNFAGLNDPTGASGGPCDFPGVFTTPLDGSDFVEVWGAYGYMGWDVTDRLTIDLEGRYQEDKRSDGISGVSTTFKDFIPRLTVTYRLTDNVTTYLLGTQGLLPGVVNANFNVCQDHTYTQPFIDPFTGQPSTSNECQQVREQLGDLARAVTEQQTLDSFEFGVKTEWLDGRLIANLSAYHQEWKNQPSTLGVRVFRDDNLDGVPNENPNTYSLAIAGSSEYSGIELEAAFSVTQDWSVAYNLSYNENEFVAFNTAPTSTVAGVLGTTNLKGNQNSRFPKWSWNLSSTYMRPLGTGWDLFARGDILFQGEAPAGTDNLAILRDYYLTNLRMGIENESTRLEMYVKNAFDEDSWRSGTTFTDFTLSGNGFDFSNAGIILIPQDRRTFGVRVSYSF